MHVFADLRPYICTFPDCQDELAQFTTRAAWADHELTEHRYDMILNCPECSEKFAGTSEWEQHLHEIHQRTFTGSQLHWARTSAYQMHPRPPETEECPLCRVVLGKPRRTFVKHVARHMEEIALMALPRNIEEDSDRSSDSTDQISLESGNPELLATNIVDLPPDTREDRDEGSESSISTLKGSLDAHDAELQPVESAPEAGEERKLQPVESAPEAGEERKLQPVESAAQAGRQRKLQPVESAAEAGGERKLHSSGSPKSGRYSLRPPPLPRPPPRPAFWICGNCGLGGMSIVYNACCTAPSCGRPKDWSAREY